jgi:hypothetical protein
MERAAHKRRGIKDHRDYKREKIRVRMDNDRLHLLRL